MKIPRQEYISEFKKLAVKRIKAGILNNELGVCEQTLRNWIMAADASKINKPSSNIFTPEQIELSR